MLEINGNPNRRDLSERHARLAAEAGVMICVNTDAHGVDTLDNMAYADRHRAPRLADRRRRSPTRGRGASSRLRKRSGGSRETPASGAAQ